MKVATIFFRDEDVRRRYLDLLRERMYAAGYSSYDASNAIFAWFGGGGSPRRKIGLVSGTADVERAADVAHEVRGVMVKIGSTP